MGINSFCKKLCSCCKCAKNTKGDSLEAKASKSRSMLNVVNQDSILIPMNLDEIETHCKDKKNIYAHAVETMKNFLGKPCYPYLTLPKQLYPYILLLCDDLQAHEYVAIKEMISEKQLLDIQLTVVIKDAKVIHPKITEFSRILCKLWITNGQEQLTSVKYSSSYLLWDETFILDVVDYESDVFHVEIWSFRSELLDKITTLHFESFKDNDPLAEEKGVCFIGDTAEYVKALPCVGQNMLWTLRKGPRRIYIKGQLNVFIQLGTKRSPDFFLHLNCHMTILRLCYEKQVLGKEESHTLWKNWLEILPNAAVTLIQQHAIQHGITPVEQCLCSWLVTSSLKMRLEDRISFYLLKDLLEYLLANIEEDQIGQMKEVLAKSISDFSMFSMDVLRDLHKNFDIVNPEMAEELFYLLRCMSICEMKLTTNYMDSYEIIQEEASAWYLKIIGDLKKDLEADDSIEEMGEGLKNILKIYLKNHIFLDDIFVRAWNVPYTCMTYQRLDEVVCTTIQPMIKHLMVIIEDPDRKRKASESLQLLRLYHTVRNLVNYVLNCMPSQKAIIRMEEYSNWFGEEIILEWFLLCDMYTSPFIQRAVLADTMEKLNPDIVHGTSVADVATIIDEMVIEVWMKLNWKEQFYTHGALIEAAKSCVLDYGTFLLDRIEIEKYFCLTKPFEVTDKLCVALSNVCSIAEHLRKTNKKIKKELTVAESALGFEISESLISMQSDMQIIAARIFLLVIKKFLKTCKKLLKEAVYNKTDFASLGLYSYVDNTLEVFYRNLKKEVFYVTLRHMWVVVVKALKHGLKYSEGCFITRKRKLNIYMVILQTFNQMKTIFFCDGHGLTESEIENKISENLKHNLEGKLKSNPGFCF